MENIVKQQDAVITGDYKVDLAVFQGPLDLLLYLIKKEEVDIYDIPIAKVTRQYLKYIEMMTSLDLEIAGEFILMAATLIRIKTRLLLPRDPETTDEPDPRDELISALIEYKKYREAGDILKEKAIAEEKNYPTPAPVTAIAGRVDMLPATTLYDLISAFGEVLKVKKVEVIHEVDLEEVSIEERMIAVVDYLQDKEYATFVDLFSDAPRRITAVVTFIALLELARSRRIAIFQSIPFAELRIYRGEQFDSPKTDLDLVDLTQEEYEKEVVHE